MKKIKIKLKTSLAMLIIIAIFTISVITTNQNTSILTNVEATEKTIGWGIKRAQNHEQPDVGESNKKH